MKTNFLQVMLLDYAKNFDYVNPNILMSKLENTPLDRELPHTVKYVDVPTIYYVTSDVGDKYI